MQSEARPALLSGPGSPLSEVEAQATKLLAIILITNCLITIYIHSKSGSVGTLTTLAKAATFLI